VKPEETACLRFTEMVEKPAKEEGAVNTSRFPGGVHHFFPMRRRFLRFWRATQPRERREIQLTDGMRPAQTRSRLRREVQGRAP